MGQQIADLIAERFVLGVIRDDYDQVLAELTRRHGELSAAPRRNPETRAIPTGRTFTQRWEGLAGDVNARRFLMISAGFRLNVAKTVTDMLVAWNTNPDLARRAGLAASGRAITPGPAPWGTNIISLDSKGRSNLGEVLGIPAEDSPDCRKYQETPGWNCSDGQGDREPEDGQ